jgi:porin
MATTALSQSLAALLIGAALLAAGAGAASAQEGPSSTSAQASNLESNFWDRPSLTGDWGGLRKSLEDRGIKFGLQEQAEAWGNAVGGLRQGASANGLAIPTLSLDLEKLWGLKGGTFYSQAYQIHGYGPSALLVGNQQLLSNIEATPALRLYMLYYEQTLFNERLNVRIGQEGANDEMMISSTAQLFLNSSFGFPDYLAQNLPNGGPNYPMSVPMVRARLKLTDELTVMGAVFDGDPAGPGVGDPQKRNASGTEFRLQDPPLIFGEVWYSIGQDEKSKVLPATFKLGGWYHAGVFKDELRDISGGSLASPTSSGIARRFRGDYALYGIFDQMLWQAPGTKDGGITAFGLVMGGPDDRNRENFYAEGGFQWKGLFGRANDIAGIAVAYARTSDSLRQLGSEIVAETGTGRLYEPSETVIEATYYHQVAPWLSIQPDLQYVINPGASLDFANRNFQSPADSLTFGVRTRVDF